MKRMALVARVTVWTALLAAALAGRQAFAAAPSSCTETLFAPPPMSPHFTMPSAGAWTGYRGAAIEHDWTDARRRLTGPRPMSFRPLRSLLSWLESLLMPRSHQSAVCLHCQAAPLDFELGYDRLPIDQEYFRDEPPAPVPTPVPTPLTRPAAPVPSPLFNPLPVELEPSQPPAEGNPPVVADPPATPTPMLPPVDVAPELEPPQRLSPPPVVELAPEVTLPMDPPVRTLPPRNTIPKPSPKPPKNLVPRYSK